LTPRIVAYQVQNDGYWDPIAFTKKKLKQKEVIILVNDERKELWIWIGKKADVRNRFISSNAAAEIRRLYGLTLRVRSADQGSEPADFWNCINSIPPEGIGPSVAVLKKAEIATNLKLDDKRKKEPTKRTVKKGSKKSEPQKPTRKTTKSVPIKVAMNSPQTKLNTENFIVKPSLLTTPPCPKCQKGNLLPYSEIVYITSRRKDILPIAKWVCSNCAFTPENL
jgi:hypothetical protein